MLKFIMHCSVQYRSLRPPPCRRAPRGAALPSAAQRCARPCAAVLAAPTAVCSRACGALSREATSAPAQRRACLLLASAGCAWNSSPIRGARTITSSVQPRPAASRGAPAAVPRAKKTYAQQAAGRTQCRGPPAAAAARGTVARDSARARVAVPDRLQRVSACGAQQGARARSALSIQNRRVYEMSYTRCTARHVRPPKARPPGWRAFAPPRPAGRDKLSPPDDDIARRHALAPRPHRRRR